MALEADKMGAWRSFGMGLLTGLLFALLGLGVGIYVLNILGVVVVSVVRVPEVQAVLYWTYDNLRLSVIPFAAIALLYAQQLRNLNRLLNDECSTAEQVVQAEKWVDSSTALFFGVGVVWTAIGMRSSLLLALGGLDQTTAARLGAFGILRRLVDGGILLALSTTIVGAVGGYLMRLGKTLLVGAKLERFHNRLAHTLFQQFDRRLESIESYVAAIATQQPDSSSRAEDDAVRCIDVAARNSARPAAASGRASPLTAGPDEEGER